MKATVKYNSDGKPYRIIVGHDRDIDTTFKMDGTTAVAEATTVAENQGEVYLATVSEHLEYVEELPFVQAVTLDSEAEE